MKRYLTLGDVNDAACRLVALIRKHFAGRASVAIYGVPRGGVPVALALLACSKSNGGTRFVLTELPSQADLFVDDLIDTGATHTLYRERYPKTPFFALFNKQTNPDLGWLVFPWEADGRSEDDSIVGTLRNRGNLAVANASTLNHPVTEQEMTDLEAEVATRYQGVLDALLIDTANDPNTQGTAKRYAKMMVREVLCGRFSKPPEVTVFPNTKKLDELYLSGPNTLRSLCSHHFCPILGQFWIGVLPGEKLLGLSKFNRVVDWLAARGQIQEELTVQIADELEALIQPRGLAVVVRARHTCMTWRGVRECGDAQMTTSVMRGVLRDNASAKAEFMQLCGL